jgi:DNA polymerase/3'-5' exonuclease PolX
MRLHKAMSKKTKKKTKAIGKSVRRAVKRHSIATGVLTGAATAVALSTTGATKKLSEAVGSGVAGLLKVKGKRSDVIRSLKKKTGDALVRAGRSLQPDKEPQLVTTDGKVSTTTRKSAAARTAP